MLACRACSPSVPTRVWRIHCRTVTAISNLIAAGARAGPQLSASPPTSRNWPASAAACATATSPPCSTRRPAAASPNAASGCRAPMRRRQDRGPAGLPARRCRPQPRRMGAGLDDGTLRPAAGNDRAARRDAAGAFALAPDPRARSSITANCGSTSMRKGCFPLFPRIGMLLAMVKWQPEAIWALTGAVHGDARPHGAHGLWPSRAELPAPGSGSRRAPSRPNGSASPRAATWNSRLRRWPLQRRDINLRQFRDDAHGLPVAAEVQGQHHALVGHPHDIAVAPRPWRHRCGRNAARRCGVTCG